jgi:uncharacterized protein (TIGR02145 family)
MKNQIFRKFILLNFCLLTFNFLLQAQPPLRFSYQSIIRNPAGQALQNQSVGIRLSLLQGSESGTAVYVETHSATTNTSGLVTLQVGGGTVVSGSIASINWASGPYFIKTETDPEGGSNYTISGTSQLLSVPFALYSANGTTGPQGPAGPNGKNALIRTTPEAAGANCANGGVKIEAGLDSDGNGQLGDSEVNTAQTKFICNGSGGDGISNGTSPGQMLYWNGTAWIPINPGINGQALTFCNGVPIWGLCPDGLPTLSTVAIINGSFAISSGGNISSDGGSNIIARGVCWDTNPNPTIALITKTNDGAGIGSFNSSVSGLTPNTTYYVRAFASNLSGTSYGNQLSVQTGGTGTVVDVDGNSYQTLTYGSQEWMKENLKTSKYRNGDPIPTNLSDAAWLNTTSGAYAIYNNDAANNTTYGKLYNWYAVADPRGLCPTGWHAPSDAEWTTLENFLGGANRAGGKMKSTGTIQVGTGLWQDPNAYASNSSGFTGLPGGLRLSNGSYYYIGNYGNWWSSSELSSTSAWPRLLNYNNGSSQRIENNSAFNSKAGGFSVRCLRD